MLDFQAEHEKDPTNGSELLNVVLRRLRNIQYDVEKGDNSLRGLFNADTPEEGFQKYIAAELKKHARLRNTVAREPEVDGRKKPDIRIYHQATSPVSIEIKKAHERSLNQHIDHIKKQLAGRYLKDIHSRHGIYLLVHAKTKKRWKDQNGKLINFAELCFHLEEFAKQLTLYNPDLDRITVIGIDFT